MDKTEFSVFDEFGNEFKYEIKLAYKSLKTNKYYMVYTDNTYTEEGDLNIYAAIYDPYDETVFEEVKTEEEWDEIYDKISDLKELNK